jgi:hypothetical protein
VLLHDKPGTDFARALYEKLESKGAADITQTEHLWMVLGKN